MDEGFVVLLDAPAQPATRTQIARLGDFSDGRYGDFAITAKDVADWKRNLDALPGKRALIDADHMADKQPRKTEAYGWITNVELDGDKPMADIEWTPLGQEAIKDKRYLFFSPTYGDFKDEHGVVHKNTLTGGALTNKPFLTRLPMLQLASEERIQQALEDDPAQRFYKQALDGELGEKTKAIVMLDVAQADRDKAKAEGKSLPDGSYPILNSRQLRSAAVLASSGHGDAAAAKKLIRRRAKELGVDVATLPGFGSDSRRAMDAKLLEALGLDADADEAKVLEAVTELQAKAEKPDEGDTDPKSQKTLEQQAADAGKVVLDAAEFATIKSDATAGKQAAQKLEAMTFETAYAKALQTGRAVPAQEEQLKKFYGLDAEGTLKMLEEGPQIVNVQPTGQPVQLDATEATPDGVHAQSHQLHQKVLAKLKEDKKGMDAYVTTLESIIAEERALA